MECGVQTFTKTCLTFFFFVLFLYPKPVEDLDTDQLNPDSEVVEKKSPVLTRDLKRLPGRVPGKRGFRFGKSGIWEKGNETNFIPHLPTKKSRRSFKEIKNLDYYDTCSDKIVKKVFNDDMIIVSSSPEPQPYKCVQQFIATNETSVLRVSFLRLHLRFNCNFEKLEVFINTKKYSICSGTSYPYEFLGYSIKIVYERILFGLHGGFSFTVVARTFTRAESLVEGDTCGLSRLNDPKFIQVAPRVVNGEETKKDDFPWMVLLRIYLDDSSYFFCGGSLLSNQLVLTAAHCLETENIKKIKVGLGIYNQSDENEFGSEWLTATDYMTHPQFNRAQLLNDVGIVFLPKKVHFRPVCLPAVGLTTELGQFKATALGWGDTSFGGENSDLLQRIDIKTWTNSDCNRTWSKDLGIPISDDEICASGDGQDTCHGDSGGPLLIQLDEKWVLIGVTSFGHLCADPKYPGVYSRVSHFRDWLDIIINR